MSGKGKLARSRQKKKRDKQREQISKMGQRIQALHTEKNELSNKLMGAMKYIRFEVVELRKLKRAVELERDSNELWDLAKSDPDAAEARYKGALDEVLDVLSRVLDPVELPEDEIVQDDEIATCDECGAELDLEGHLAQADDGSIIMLCKEHKPTTSLVLGDTSEEE